MGRFTVKPVIMIKLIFYIPGRFRLFFPKSPQLIPIMSGSGQIATFARLNFSMRIRRKSRLLLAVFALLTAPAFSQSGKPWSLQECIDYALQHNIQLKQAELNAETGNINLLQSKAAILPTLNAGASHTYNFGRTIDPFTNTFATDRVLSQNFYLSSNLTLFHGLQNYNSIKQYEYARNADLFSVDKARNDVSLNVAAAYLQALYADEQLENTTKQAQLTQGQVDRMQKLVDAGAQAKGTLLDLQSQRATEEVSVVTAQNQRDIAYLTLAQLMNYDSLQNFTIVKPDLAAPADNLLTVSADQIYSTAQNTQPVVKSAEMNYRSYDKAVDVAMGGVSPTLTLGGSVGTGYSGLSKKLTGANINGLDTVGATTGGDFVVVPHTDYTYETTPFSDQLSNNLNQSIGLTLTIPLFNRLQTYGNISRAKIQRESARLNLEQTQTQLRKDIQQAWADAQAALGKYKASQKALDAAQESFRYTDQKFSLGAVSTIDYNASKTTLAKAESDLLQSKYDYIFRLKVLDYYQGKPLSF